MAKTGAARVFFDVVGRLQSTRLLADSKAAMTVQQAIILDALGAVQDAFTDMSNYVAGAVNQVVESFFDFEQQLVRVRKFYSDDTAYIGFADAAREMGEAFAFTGGEALAAAARTAQLKGVLKSQQAIIEATRQGLLLAQVGEMETEMGMNRFIALAQQTQFMYGGLTKAQYEALEAEEQANIVRQSSIHTLNQLNTIENSSVATMEDITFVLNQFASQADIAGESIGDMAAMSALLLETGEEVSRAGTGLRMIYQRLGNANNEATKAIAELIPGLDAQGVAQLKLSDVITKLAPAYAAMTAEEKRALAVNIAGSRHYIKFLKIMENQTRLSELSSAAFRAQYGAIEEFGYKTESAVFQAQQMEASLENMRAKIGEDLTGAYMQAYLAEEQFLKMTGYALKSEAIQDLVGKTMFLGQTYDKMVRPVSDVFFQIGNLIVAFRTLNAVQAKGQADIQERVRSYAEANLIANLQVGFEKKLISTGTHRLALMNREQQSRITLAALFRKEQSDALKGLNIEARRIKSGIRASEVHLRKLKASKKSRAEINKATVALRRQQNALAKNTEARKVQRSEVAKAVAQMKREQETMKITTAQKEGRIMMEKRSIEAIYKQVESQNSYNELLQTQSRLMQEEVVLYQALDAEVKENLIARNADAAMRQREQQDILAALRLQEAERMSKGLSTDEIKERIAVAQGEIQAYAETRMEIQALINADKTYQMQMKATGKTATTFVMQLKAGAKAAFTKEQAIKSLNMAAMATTMILPMVVDDSKQMSAMMYGVSLTMLTAFLPAITKGIAALYTFTGASVAATASLTVLTGGLYAIAAIAGFVLFDKLLGDKFKSDMMDIDSLNDSLNTTQVLLSDLSGAAGKEVVLEGFYDEATFNQLKQDAELTDSILADLDARLLTMAEDIGLATTAGDTEMAAGLEQSKKHLEDVRAQVSAIDKAQNIVSKGTHDILDAYTNVEVIKKSHGVLGDIFMDGEYQVYGEKNGETFLEGFGKGAEGKKAAEEFAEQLRQSGAEISEVSQEFNRSYYENLLKVQDDTNTALIEGEKRLYNTLTQEQETFANAREELFFGQRQNFTGAIYKQVVQGGVESLLHKTEIVQTNIFNGYNTEQMVDRITSGVLDELRAQGVGL
jgi:TP901 family phage tail tape measure protein